jgi:hypothetical protein
VCGGGVTREVRACLLHVLSSGVYVKDGGIG